jgi:hypothetical protein
MMTKKSRVLTKFVSELPIAFWVEYRGDRATLHAEGVERTLGDAEYIKLREAYAVRLIHQTARRADETCTVVGYAK